MSAILKLPVMSELIGRPDVKDKIDSLFSVTVITDSIYRSLIRNGGSIENVMCDLIAHPKLSLEDLACLIYLNIKGFETLFLSSLCNEIDELIRPKQHLSDSLLTKIEAAKKLAFNEIFIKQMQTSLSYNQNDNNIDIFNISIETSPPYEFVVTGTKIWLIIKLGFITFISDSETRMKFYRDYIRAVGGVATFKELCQTDIYTHYVMELLS